VPLTIDENVQASSAHDQHGDRLILTDPDGQFARNYNRRHFQFPHGLKGHPLFELSSLVDLARRPFHHEPFWSNGKVVVLKHVEQDPVYGPVLQDLLARVIELSGKQMRQDVLLGEAIILISSPNRVTSYHMDAECNFLLQVAGNKSLWVYDHTDPTLVSHEAREQYHMGNQNSIAYQESRQSEAGVYELHAGNGVHIPVFAPHWVRNHDNISVALSVNYELISTLGQKRIYQIYPDSLKIRDKFLAFCD
jgi:hypothetical protein